MKVGFLLSSLLFEYYVNAWKVSEGSEPKDDSLPVELSLAILLVNKVFSKVADKLKWWLVRPGSNNAYFAFYC